MALETIFQHELLTKFAYPFLLIFFIVFAVLEKTKLLGENKKQLNAVLAFVIGLIFLSVVQPRLIVENMILFLTVAIVIVFVVLLLWGFISGKGLESDILSNKGVKWTVGIAVVIAVIVAVFWAAGISTDAFDFLFKQSWSNTFWTNFMFVAVVAAALAVVLKSSSSKS